MTQFQMTRTQENAENTLHSWLRQVNELSPNIFQLKRRAMLDDTGIQFRYRVENTDTGIPINRDYLTAGALLKYLQFAFQTMHKST